MTFGGQFFGGTLSNDLIFFLSLTQMRTGDHSAIQKPHLFFLPDVPSVPFFPRDAHKHDIEVLEANYAAILAEFKAVYQQGIEPKSGWSCIGPKVFGCIANVLHMDVSHFLCLSFLELKVSVSIPGPGRVSSVQRWRLCGRKLSLVSLHLPDTSFPAHIYK